MFIAAFSVDFERVSHGSYSSTDPEEHSHLLRVWCEAHLGSMPQAKFDMPQSGLMVYQPGQDARILLLLRDLFSLPEKSWYNFCQLVQLVMV
jgi:hypothetical protein